MSMWAAVFELGGFWGVFEGVGSIAREEEGAEVSAEDSPRPRAAAAWAVLSAVKGPDTRRFDSGCLLLRGEGTGDVMAVPL